METELESEIVMRCNAHIKLSSYTAFLFQNMQILCIHVRKTCLIQEINYTIINQLNYLG